MFESSKIRHGRQLFIQLLIKVLIYFFVIFLSKAKLLVFHISLQCSLPFSYRNAHFFIQVHSSRCLKFSQTSKIELLAKIVNGFD